MKLNYLDSNKIIITNGLEDFNLKFNKVNCIVGSNGSGKTRLLENILEKLKKKDYEDFLDKSLTDNRLNLQDFDVRQSKIVGKEFYNDKLKSNIILTEVDLNNQNFITKMKNLIDESCLLSSTLYIDNSLKKNNIIFSNLIGSIEKKIVNTNLVDVDKYKLNNIDEALDNDAINFISDFVRKYIAHERDKDFSIKGIRLKNHAKTSNNVKGYVNSKNYEKLRNIILEFTKKSLDFEIDSINNEISIQLNNIDLSSKLFSPGETILLKYAILFFLLEISTKANIKNSIVIIDEIENHLHPEAQVILIRRLRELLKDNGQLFVATHSLHILAEMNLDEIYYVENNNIHAPGRNTPQNSIISIMGDEYKYNKLTSLLKSLNDWHLHNYLSDCLNEPDVIFSTNTNDPQYKQFKKHISSFENKLNVLDYGAGLARFYYTHKEDSLTSIKINYEAYEPNPNLLINESSEFKIYREINEIKESSKDIVLLSNVLHEIELQKWIDTFININDILNPRGYLIIMEDLYLPKGEKAHEYGFLILNGKELRTLLGNEQIIYEELDLGLDKNRLLISFVNKNRVNITYDSILKSLIQMKKRINDLLIKINNDPKNELTKSYSFYLKQFHNVSYAIDDFPKNPLPKENSFI